MHLLISFNYIQIDLHMFEYTVICKKKKKCQLLHNQIYYFSCFYCTAISIIYHNLLTITAIEDVQKLEKWLKSALPNSTRSYRTLHSLKFEKNEESWRTKYYDVLLKQVVVKWTLTGNWGLLFLFTNLCRQIAFASFWQKPKKHAHRT